MAKVQFGSGVAAISGRTAGTVFARNKGGAYMRRFSVPTNPISGPQQAARDRMATQSVAWSGIDDADRLAWNAWALTHPIIDRLGAAVALSGHQAFVALNTTRSLHDVAAQFDTPPAEPAFKTPVLNGVGTADASAQTIICQAGIALLTADRLAIWASPAVSPGVTNTSSAERCIGTLVLGAGVAKDAVLPSVGALWVGVFGSMLTLADKKINVSAYFYSRGRLSVASGCSLIVVA